MADPELLMLVKFKSVLSLEELMPLINERADRFRALTGLRQKYYFEDKQSGEVGGLYVWDSEKDFAEYRESELRASIASAYQVEGTPSVEVLNIIKVLRD